MFVVIVAVGVVVGGGGGGDIIDIDGDVVDDIVDVDDVADDDSSNGPGAICMALIVFLNGRVKFVVEES